MAGEAEPQGETYAQETRPTKLASGRGDPIRSTSVHLHAAEVRGSLRGLLVEKLDRSFIIMIEVLVRDEDEGGFGHGDVIDGIEQSCQSHHKLFRCKQRNETETDKIFFVVGQDNIAIPREGTLILQHVLKIFALSVN